MNEMEQKINSHEIRLAVLEQKVEALGKNIEKIEENTTWAVKLIIGQMIIGIIGGVIGFLFMKGGL